MSVIYTRLRTLLGIICLCICMVTAANSPPPVPSASPLADTEIICPTEHPGDCYPRVFQPTEDFQLIREGQDIPPGLHVRLNIYTGEKEARLNIPMEGEDDPALEGVPVEQAMVVVDHPETDEGAKQIHIPPNAPAYEAVGKIQQPPPNSGDSVTFGSATLSIKTGGEDFDASLDDLSELAHDIYYGVEICKDRPTVEKLLCYAVGLGGEKYPAKENKRDYKAALTLAAAIQNNPSALKEVTNFGGKFWYPQCNTGQKSGGTAHVVEILRSNLETEKDPSSIKAQVSLMKGLMKDPQVRDEFMQAGSIELLLAIWLQEGEQWDAARIKVSQLVLDTFLDEGMGAELNIWPNGPASKSKVCESADRKLDDGCWEHHVESFLKTSPKSSWAKDFLKSLREQRAKVAKPISHNEL